MLKNEVRVCARHETSHESDRVSKPQPTVAARTYSPFPQVFVWRQRAFFPYGGELHCWKDSSICNRFVFKKTNIRSSE
ncbi:Hypothetical protein, putative [Bodo saltans]|uniref:Uncharacterized protein n=1 Tax=Bodo saltans TaxID=75058 RepID=A0A0S4J9H0_BODSA|nr:Hypothetical protein, putative [Bodo saltans]|eukprot:CUG86126.1 Hypothetical protein, putative [Bodo saltans]